MPEKPIYYTDTLAAAKRFEEVKAKLLEQKRIEDIRRVIPQGHGSGLNADMLDGLHAEDFLVDIRRAMNQPRKGGGGGGGIPSNPPSGKKAITNIYWDGDTNEIVIEYEQ